MMTKTAVTKTILPEANQIDQKLFLIQSDKVLTGKEYQLTNLNRDLAYLSVEWEIVKIHWAEKCQRYSTNKGETKLNFLKRKFIG